MQHPPLPIHTGASEIVLYQPNQEIRLEVRLEDETVWLTQAQMALLFQTTRNNVTLHIKNIFKEGELQRSSVCKESLQTAADGKNYKTQFYNLDVIISVGYRVKSLHGTRFRQWANSVLKDYLLKGYSINQRFERLEQRVSKTEEKIDFFVRTYSTRFHDRFLIIDDTVYHFGASFKDLGRRLFAFTRMEASPAVILSQL